MKLKALSLTLLAPAYRFFCNRTPYLISQLMSALVLKLKERLERDLLQVSPFFTKQRAMIYPHSIKLWRKK